MRWSELFTHLFYTERHRWQSRRSPGKLSQMGDPWLAVRGWGRWAGAADRWSTLLSRLVGPVRPLDWCRPLRARAGWIRHLERGTGPIGRVAKHDLSMSGPPKAARNARRAGIDLRLVSVEGRPRGSLNRLDLRPPDAWAIRLDIEPDI